MKYLFTSEFVGRGHPDKVADQISDAIVDYVLSKESEARVASEVLVTTNNVILGGETRTKFIIQNEDIYEIVRRTIRNIGYTDDCFHWQKVKIQNFMHEQSRDIAQGVDSTEHKEEGAGDQGIMFGHANSETDMYMPMAIYYAGKLTREMEKAIQIHHLPFGPDMKCQVTLQYEDGVAVAVDTLLVSIQHTETTTLETIQDFVRSIAKKVFLNHLPIDNIIVNPTGRFVVGGPHGDTGLTGRKIIVDTYGGYAPHGGGAFSGKDPTKVDRSGAYMCRYLAKNIVAGKFAEECLIQLSYAIGISKPLSLYIDTKGTGKISDEHLAEIIANNVDLSPKGIRSLLNLNKPIYEVTSYGGHFGRVPYEEFFPWEQENLISELNRWL